MGHLSDLRHGAAVRPAVADRARIVLAVMLIALAPDGRMQPDSLRRVHRVCRGAPVLAGIGGEALDELAALTLRALAARGPDRVLGDLRGLIQRPLAETALVMAIRAAFDEGRIAPDVLGILGGLANYMSIAAAQLSDMLETVGALERPFD